MADILREGEGLNDRVDRDDTDMAEEGELETDTVVLCDARGLAVDVVQRLGDGDDEGVAGELADDKRVRDDVPLSTGDAVVV